VFNSSSTRADAKAVDGRRQRTPRHEAADSPTQQLGHTSIPARPSGRSADQDRITTRENQLKTVTVGDVLARWRTVMACALVAALAGTVYVILAGPAFTSHASLLLASSNPSESSGQETRADLETESRVIVSEPVLAAAAQTTGSTFADLLASVEATPVTNTRILQLSVRGSSPDDARSRTQAVIDTYRSQRVRTQQIEIDQYREYVATELARIQQARDSSRPSGGTQAALDAQRSQLLTDLSVVEGAARTETGGVSVIDPPLPPSTVSAYTVVALQAGLAILVGLVVGATLILVRLATSKRIETARQVGDIVNVPILAHVGRYGRGKSAEAGEPAHVPSLEGDDLHAVRRALALAGSRTVALCSVNETRCSRLVALSVAAGSASRGGPILLISALEFPEADDLLNEAENRPPGLAGVARGQSTVREMALTPERTNVANLWFVPRAPAEDDVSLLSSTAAHQAIAECGRWWSECFVTCTGSDLPLLGESIEVVVLVIDLGETDDASLREVVRYSRGADCEIAGAIVVGR
jgi:capsular polysaccharide biosynthesis protein